MNLKIKPVAQQFLGISFYESSKTFVHAPGERLLLCFSNKKYFQNTEDCK